MAVALSKAGADVILVQRDTKNTATKELIEKEGGKADIVVADLADKESVAKLIPHVTGELGRTLDVVVNCGTCGRYLFVAETEAPAGLRDRGMKAHSAAGTALIV